MLRVKRAWRGPTFYFAVPGVGCPGCGAPFTGMAVSEGDDYSEPEEGEVLVCSICRVVLILRNHRPELLTPEEWQSMPSPLQAIVCRAQRAVH